MSNTLLENTGNIKTIHDELHVKVYDTKMSKHNGNILFLHARSQRAVSKQIGVKLLHLVVILEKK